MGCSSVDSDRLYKLLDVEKTASRTEIRKAHQKLARAHHPDRGGDPEKFKDIQQAYETLSDPEKRAHYDNYGEKGQDAADSEMDFFDLLRRSDAQRNRKQRTKNLVTPLKMTLEQLYSGITKKMAVNRQVVDKADGIKPCHECKGRGVRMESVQLGSSIQQMQSACGACGGTGKLFKRRREREVLEVHVPKGSPNGHKLVFREKADELPDADTGDVVFVLQEQEHPDFKRRGADLFIERTISLSEALCGFEMEVTHLDGRKLLIKSSPGEVVRPIPRGFNPLVKSDELEWECLEGFACPDIETVARAEETDAELLKQASQTQLKRRGVDVGAFVVDSKGAQFKQCTYAEAMAAKKPCAGSKMYVVADPATSKPHRMMKAVQGEGMPTLKNPFTYGNLFLILTIEFPDSLPEATLEALKQMLPPPLNAPKLSEDDTSVEVHTLSDIDPRESEAANKANMQAAGEAYDEDGDRGGSPGGQGPRCQQM